MYSRESVMVYNWAFTDPRLDRLRSYQREFFYKLWVVIDDDGRFLADEKQLRGVLYSGLLHQVSRGDVQGYLVALHHAGLVRLYTVRGIGYGKIHGARQRKRGLMILYPGVEEAEIESSPGELFRVSASNESTDPPANLAPSKREGMNEGGECSHGAPPPARFEKSMEDQDTWLAGLALKHSHVNIKEQLTLARDNRRKQGKKLERAWFEDHWIPKCSPVVADDTPTRKPPPSPAETSGAGDGGEHFKAVWTKAAQGIGSEMFVAQP